MQVTGTRAAGAMKATGSQEKPKKAPKKQPAHFEDGFDAPVKKPKATKGPKKPPKLAASPALLQTGQATVDQHRATGDRFVLRAAAQVLGGLTAAVVASVLHQFQAQPDAALERGVAQLGALTSAFFVEFLGEHVQPDAAAVVDEVVADVDDFSQRFEASFGVSPLEAARRFIDFIASTEGQPRRRLAGTLYDR